MPKKYFKQLVNISYALEIFPVQTMSFYSIITL